MIPLLIPSYTAYRSLQNDKSYELTWTEAWGKNPTPASEAVKSLSLSKPAQFVLYVASSGFM